MKKLSVKKGSQCMACLECVRACSTAFYKEFHQNKSCIQIIERNGQPKPMVCVQCGKCAQACEHCAITQNAKGVYMINKKLCVQCGKCAEACPNGAITQNAKGVYTVNKKLCTGCGKCVEACPFGVMVKAETSEFASKCIACGICAKACPMELLEVVEK